MKATRPSSDTILTMPAPFAPVPGMSARFAESVS